MNTEVLEFRALLLSALRDFFRQAGFVEVDTPVLVPFCNPDSGVECVSATFFDFTGKRHNWFLHASPEFFMKRLLWSGMKKVFQICKVFRSGEVTPLHNVEFTMVEWYRTQADYTKGMTETVSLLHAVLEAFNQPFFLVKGKKVFPGSPEYITVSDAFKRFAGVADVLDEELVTAVAGESDYESAFFKLLVEKVEPAISQFDVPVFLFDYPEPFSAMAKVRGAFAERFEVYIGGVELANGYTELTGFDDYLRKFKKAGKDAFDYNFLRLLLERPLPPCEGVALGFDRLLMVILGEEDIRKIIPFSTDALITLTDRSTPSPD